VKNTNLMCVTRLVTVAGLALAASTLTATPENPSGAPEGYTGAGNSGVVHPSVPDDAFNAPTKPGTGVMMLPETQTEPANPGTGHGPLDRIGNVVVEFDDNATAEQLDLAAQIDAAWQTGEFDAGRDLIAQLRATGFEGGMGFSWDQEGEQGASKIFDVFNPDRRVGAPRDGATGFEMDFAPGGNLYVLVSWPDGWSMNRSTNGGNTWTETYFWLPGPGGFTDADIAVVDGFVYVGYIAEDIDARLRRLSAATGIVDNAYFFETILTAVGAEMPLLDVAIEGNADSFENRIFYSVLKSDNTIYFGFDDSDDGTTFFDRSPPAANAVGPIDMHWNEGFASEAVFMSYLDTSGNIHAASWGGGVPWTDTIVTNTTAFNPDVKISAYQDTIIVGYENPTAGGDPAVSYQISYNGGTSYASGSQFPAGSPSPFMTDVAAGLGYGTAQVTNFEDGAFDPIELRQRPTYAPGFWPNSLVTNEVDLLSGGEMAVEALPAPAGVARYGVMFLDGNRAPYFDRVDISCPGDIADDFGSIGPDGMVSFGDFLALLGLVGPCPGGTPGCIGDIADDFGTIGPDGMVSFGDFLALLGLVGPC